MTNRVLRNLKTIVYFFNDYLGINRFFEILNIMFIMEFFQNGVILGEKLQPHEAHIPYILQFMIDYNIYGMSFVSFSKIKYRKDPENPGDHLFYIAIIPKIFAKNF